MDKKIFDYNDHRLTAATAHLYELRVLAGADGLALLTLTKGVEVGCIQRWNFNRKPEDSEAAILADLQAVCAREDLFSYPFARVRWAWFNGHLTLVPRRFFNPKALDSYFKLLLHEAPKHCAYTDWPATDCAAVYALPPQWPALCNRFFPKAEQSHFGASMLQYWQQTARKADYDAFLHIHHTQAQVAIFDRQNLLFYNSFDFAQANDILYFVLLAYEQCKLNPLETPLCISGQLLQESEGWKQLYRYIRHLHFADAQSPIMLPKMEGEWPLHCQLDLML